VIRHQFKAQLDSSFILVQIGSAAVQDWSGLNWADLVRSVKMFSQVSEVESNLNSLKSGISSRQTISVHLGVERLKSVEFSQTPVDFLAKSP
jgi:hypothetical protein